MIDLHIHSTNSDGSKTVLEILNLAEELHLTNISLTDHENCNAYEELKNIDVKEYFSGKIIPGIELKSRYKNIVMDILGYGIDPEKMKQYLNECYKGISRGEIQKKQLQELYDMKEKYGLKLRPMEELVWDKNTDWGSIVFYDEMKSHIENKDKVPEDLWESFSNFKKKYYHIEGKMFYFDRAKYYPELAKIIDIIHKSGGKAFVAHIFEYKEIEDKMQELKNIVQNYDIDGIECYHSIFSDEESKMLIEFTAENRLLISGGSDYHGNFKKNIELGIGKGNLNIPESILDNWNII